MIGRDLLPPLSSFFLELVATGAKVTEALVTHDEKGFGVRAGAAGEKEEFADASGASVDKDAASEGVSRRMRQ